MASGGWKLVDNPGVAALWHEQYDGKVDPPKTYSHPCGLVALLGREPVADDDWRWHISVRYGDPGRNGRICTWEELVRTAHELRPGVVFVIGVPPRSWWMNVHPHVLHLYETTDAHLIASYRENANGDRPS